MKMAKRSCNFSTTETNMLLDLVDRHKDTLENKKTDRVTTEDKNRAWTEICREFNANFIDNIRSEKVLLTKYNNIKRTAKENYAKDRRESYKTGGGTKATSAITPSDERILGICQVTQLRGNKSVYDEDIQNDLQDMYTDLKLGETDSDEQATKVAEAAKEVEIVKDNATPKEDERKKTASPFTKNTWAHMLKKERHHKLQTSRKTLARDAWAQEAEKKIEKLNMEMNFLKERHDFEMQIARLKLEEQNLKIVALRTRDNK